MEPIIATLINQAIGLAAQEISKDPQAALKTITDLLGCRHTGADCIQDIWDAVAAGNLSPSAAMQATQAIAADLERQQQKPVAPPTPNYSQALTFIRQTPEYQSFRR